MPLYNYFCCRSHNPPVKKSVETQTTAAVWVAPVCPVCRQRMERYGQGQEPNDSLPVPPSAPPVEKGPKLSNKEVLIYSGSGDNPGHGPVTWNITRNDAQLTCTIQLDLGKKIAGAYESSHTIKMVSTLIDPTQVGDAKNWWVIPPATTAGGNKEVWYSLDIAQLPGNAVLNNFPVPNPRIDVGIKLGNATFGLIHLLAGHVKTVRKAASGDVFSTGDPRDEFFRTMVLMQSGLSRFDPDKLQTVKIPAGGQNKYLFKGANAGFLVISKMPGDARYSITTTYNKAGEGGGVRVYKRA